MEGSLLNTFLVYTLIVAFVVVFFIIIPNKKKSAKKKAVLDDVQPGDEICTVSGTLCTVVERDGDVVKVLIDEETGTTMRIVIYAVQSVVEKAKDRSEG